MYIAVSGERTENLALCPHERTAEREKLLLARRERVVAHLAIEVELVQDSLFLVFVVVHEADTAERVVEIGINPLASGIDVFAKSSLLKPALA